MDSLQYFFPYYVGGNEFIKDSFKMISYIFPYFYL